MNLRTIIDRFSSDQMDPMVSYRANRTGIDNTIFISPRGNARHGPRLKVALDPPHSLSPTGKTASISIIDYSTRGVLDPTLYRQLKAFIDLNRDVLLDYWNEMIATDELQDRLRAI